MLCIPHATPQAIDSSTVQTCFWLNRRAPGNVLSETLLGPWLSVSRALSAGKVCQNSASGSLARRCRIGSGCRSSWPKHSYNHVPRRYPTLRSRAARAYCKSLGYITTHVCYHVDTGNSKHCTSINEQAILDPFYGERELICRDTVRVVRYTAFISEDMALTRQELRPHRG